MSFYCPLPPPITTIAPMGRIADLPVVLRIMRLLSARNQLVSKNIPNFNNLINRSMKKSALLLLLLCGTGSVTLPGNETLVLALSFATAGIYQVSLAYDRGSAGYQPNAGWFANLGAIANFWSSPELSSLIDWYRSLHNYDDSVYWGYGYRVFGFSVRCLNTQ